MILIKNFYMQFLVILMKKINEQDFHEVLEKDKILENIEKVKITNLVRNYHERKKGK